MNGRRVLAFLLSSGALSGVQACEGLAIEQAWIREPPPAAVVAGAFMTLRNTGALPLRIDAARSPRFGSIMFHATEREGDQVRMVSQEALTVAPHGSLVLAPGGMHLMLMQAAEPVRAGEEIDLELQCGASGRTVRARVLRDDPV